MGQSFEKHFDRIFSFRMTSRPASCRGIARALAGLSLTWALVPLLGLTDAEAKKKRKKKCKGKETLRQDVHPPKPLLH